MAKAMLLSIHDYFKFMGDALILRQVPEEPNHVYICVNGVDNVHQICKESLLINDETYSEFAEPLFILTSTFDQAKTQELLMFLNPVVNFVVSKYGKNCAIFIKPTLIGKQIMLVLYGSMFFEKESYEDMMFLFRTYCAFIREMEKMAIRRLYDNYIAKGHLTLNYTNPIVNVNYVREVMSSSV